jgi:hypothetical protein
MWSRPETATLSPWYDNTDAFVKLYPASGSAKYTGTFTYTWRNMPGGRFKVGSDIALENTWWRYDPDSDTLIIGTTSDPDVTDFKVNDTFDDLPWQQVINNDATAIKHIIIQGGIQLGNPEKWFKGYTSLLNKRTRYKAE